MTAMLVFLKLSIRRLYTSVLTTEQLETIESRRTFHISNEMLQTYTIIWNGTLLGTHTF